MLLLVRRLDHPLSLSAMQAKRMNILIYSMSRTWCRKQVSPTENEIERYYLVSMFTIRVATHSRTASLFHVVLKTGIEEQPASADEQTVKWHKQVPEAFLAACETDAVIPRSMEIGFLLF